MHCVQVWGNLVGFIERLDDELFKSLQVLDPHTNLYLERMKDEPLFLALAQKVSTHELGSPIKTMHITRDQHEQQQWLKQLALSRVRAYITSHIVNADPMRLHALQ